MMTKADLISKLLETTIRFTADGHIIVISQFEDDDPIIRIDGEQATPEDIHQYNHFVIPSSNNSAYGVMEVDFAGEYEFTDDDILNDITPKNVGSIVTINGVVDTASTPEPVIDRAVFECKGCMRLHEVKQTLEELHQPAVCTECGGKKFKLLPNDSSFIERQMIMLSVDELPYLLPVELTGSRTNYFYPTDTIIPNPGQNRIFRGVLMVDFKGKQNTYYLKYAEDITDWYGRT